MRCMKMIGLVGGLILSALPANAENFLIQLPFLVMVHGATEKTIRLKLQQGGERFRSASTKEGELRNCGLV